MLLTLRRQITTIPIRDPFIDEIQVFSRLFPNLIKMVLMNQIILNVHCRKTTGFHLHRQLEEKQ